MKKLRLETVKIRAWAVVAIWAANDNADPSGPGAQQKREAA